MTAVIRLVRRTMTSKLEEFSQPLKSPDDVLDIARTMIREITSFMKNSSETELALIESMADIIQQMIKRSVQTGRDIQSVTEGVVEGFFMPLELTQKEIEGILDPMSQIILKAVEKVQGETGLAAKGILVAVLKISKKYNFDSDILVRKSAEVCIRSAYDVSFKAGDYVKNALFDYVYGCYAN